MRVVNSTMPVASHSTYVGTAGLGNNAFCHVAGPMSDSAHRTTYMVTKHPLLGIVFSSSQRAAGRQADIAAPTVARPAARSVMRLRWLRCMSAFLNNWTGRHLTSRIHSLSWLMLQYWLTCTNRQPPKPALCGTARQSNLLHERNRISHEDTQTTDSAASIGSN